MHIAIRVAWYPDCSMGLLAADLVPFGRANEDRSPVRSQYSEGELALVYPWSNLVRIVGAGPAGPLSRLRKGEVALPLTDPDEFHGSGGSETVELCPSDAGGRLLVRFVAASGREAILFPIENPASQGPIHLQGAVAAYALADGVVLAIESAGSGYQLAIVRPDGRVERTPIPELGHHAKFVRLASGWMFWTVQQGRVKELYAQRVGANGLGPGPAVRISALTLKEPHYFPFHVHLRGQHDQRFLAVGISNGSDQAQLATSFLRGGRWEPLQIHPLHSLHFHVSYDGEVGRVAWCDSEDFHSKSSNDLFLLEVRPGKAASVLRRPGLPAARFMNAALALLDDQLLSVWIDEDRLLGRSGTLAAIGSLPDRVLSQLPPNSYWSLDMEVRAPYALVLLRNNQTHDVYAIQVDARGNACCARLD